ncbi:MAG: hypothetical protein RLZZ111_1022 [Planctomycetota bacterium]|jgi:hypothetical protein
MVTVWMRRQESLGIVLVLAAAVAGGCKSGSSWTAKPSWWTFGDASKDPAALASAPPAPTDVTKPSAAAKPYPTTTTPEGYVLDNAQRSGAPQVAATTSSPTEPAAVTYGSAPVAPPAAAPLASQAAVAPAAAGSLSSITPQVGPYGSAPGSSPSDQSLPATSTAGYPAPLGAQDSAPAPTAPPSTVSAFGAPAATTPGFDPAGTRVADARGSEAWPTPSAPAAGGGDSRYGLSNGSRFSGGMSAMPAAAAPAEAFTPAAPPAEMVPPAAAPTGLPVAAPAAAPAQLAPPTPTRRPDAGYRPAGTSSYLPSRTILAGDASVSPSAVQPASYEAAIPAG